MQSRSTILAQLQQEILALQGIKSAALEETDEIGLGLINRSFPNHKFPLKAVHEFFSTSIEELTASGAFVSGILSSQMQKGGVAIWAGTSQKIFPPALQLMGIKPEQIVFIDIKKEKEVLWVVEEALKCGVLAGVICQMQELGFTASRRFQLAIEKSGVPLFVLRQNPKNLATTAVTRWSIKPLPSQLEDDLPGIGYPRWQVNLLKARNGRAGSWELEWRKGRFYHQPRMAVLQNAHQRKTG